MIEADSQKIRFAFLWTRLLSTPFYVLFSLLPYILYKDVGATLFQVTTLIILKPAISLAAPYLSVWMELSPKKLASRLVAANTLKFFPFLFIPWIDRVEYFSLASIVYLFLGRGVMPAWIEILKLNLNGVSRTKTFAYAQAFDYLGIAIFPLVFGSFLDAQPESWRILFSAAASVGILSSLFLLRIKVGEAPLLAAPARITFGEPWRQSWNLLKLRPDFSRFQVGFMLGGTGLMVLQPALPLFFTDTLHLSYKEMALAIAFCKGVGYAAATPFWTRFFDRLPIFQFCGMVTVLAALFPLILLLSGLQLSFLWVAFLSYGVMQAGSELSWHLSGPTFSREASSAAYSQTNILAQGIRGAVAPYLGMLACQLGGAEAALVMGALFCFLGTRHMLLSSTAAYLESP